jgi:3-methyl-2-oxobutanoate hydroxymethyltransferase
MPRPQEIQDADYDAYGLRLSDRADRSSRGIDCILVGDSAAQAVSWPSHTPRTMDYMITITPLSSAAPRAFLIGACLTCHSTSTRRKPFETPGGSWPRRGCDCVKIEGDARIAPTVVALTAASIPVMAHLGLRPQAVHQFGGYRAQGRDAGSAQRLINDARSLEEAGACGLLLEAVPPEPARMIAEATPLPVIGCGAGPFCDGQVMVLHDMLGLSNGPLPRFVKAYSAIREEIAKSVGTYISDVLGRRYPAPEHCYQMEPGEDSKFTRATRSRDPD